MKSSKPDYSFLPKKFYVVFSNAGVVHGWTDSEYIATTVIQQRGDAFKKKLKRSDLTEGDSTFIGENEEFLLYSEHPPMYLTTSEMEVVEGGEQYLVTRISDLLRSLVPLIYTQKFSNEERSHLHLLFRKLNSSFLSAEADTDYEDNDALFNGIVNVITYTDYALPKTLKPEFVEAFNGLEVVVDPTAGEYHEEDDDYD